MRSMVLTFVTVCVLLMSSALWNGQHTLTAADILGMVGLSLLWVFSFTRWYSELASVIQRERDDRN